MSQQIQPGLHTLIYAERGQRYSLSVPDDYDRDKNLPLVIALHWGGVVTPFYSQPFLEGLVEPALNGLSALIAAPDCQHGVWTNPDSESEVLRLVDYLRDQFPIDSQRIALTGYSMGGAGTWYLAARNQDVFTAAIPVAGMPQVDSARIDWRIPLYVIHSRMDNVMPIVPTDLVVRELEKRGIVVKFVAIEGLPHYQTSEYLPYLRETAAWLQDIWTEEKE